MTWKKSMVLAVAATALAAMLMAQENALHEAEIVSLADWRNEDLYEKGKSARNLIDSEVFGEAGDEIGDVENIIIGVDGKVHSIVAEFGGFWDIGDTHVSVPIDRVDMADSRITIPVTEATIDDYGFWDDEPIDVDATEIEIVEGVDDEPIPRAWRASELIGDYARLWEGDTFGNYGYVRDLILRDDEVAAVVVEPSPGCGGAYRAYPYYGYSRGWSPGSPYYDMPYTAGEVGDMESFDYDSVDT